MRSFENFEVVYTENCDSKSIALKREAEIKKMTKTDKEKLIKLWD